MVRRLLPLALLCGCGGSPAVLSPMRLVTVAAANDPDRSTLFQFSEDVFASQWWRAIADDYQLSAEQLASVTGPPLEGDFTQAELIQYLEQNAQVSCGGEGQCLYLLYVPPQAQVNDMRFQAVHGPLSNGAEAWALVTRGSPYPGGETILQATTRLASHEIAEAATDPGGHGYTLGTTPAQPWKANPWRSYEPSGDVEIADQCEGSRWIEPDSHGTSEYQRVWSTRAALKGEDPCVPARAEPYFNVAAPEGWYPAAPGSRAAVPLTGWATASRGDWLLGVSMANGTSAFQSAAASSIASQSGSAAAAPTCEPYPAVNRGRAAELFVDVPLNARQGDWAVFNLCSFDEDPDSCYPKPDGDVCHSALVGVYVP